MNYTEFENKLLEPVTDLITEVKGKLNVIEPFYEINGKFYEKENPSYYSLFLTIIKRAYYNHILIIDSKLLISDFFKPVDLDLKHDIAKKLIIRIDNLLSDIKQLIIDLRRKKQEDIIFVLLKTENYLNDIKTYIQVNILAHQRTIHKDLTINPTTFVSLFRNKDTAKKVKDILETKGYTNNGKWQGLSGKKTELLAAYYVLKPIFLPGKITPQATIFYNEFGLEVNKYISDRALRNEPFNSDRDEFEKIFSHLLSDSI